MRWAFDLDIPRLTGLHRPGRGKRAYGPVWLLDAGTLQTRRNHHSTLILPCTWTGLCGAVCLLMDSGLNSET